MPKNRSRFSELTESKGPYPPTGKIELSYRDIMEMSPDAENARMFKTLREKGVNLVKAKKFFENLALENGVREAPVRNKYANEMLKAYMKYRLKQ